MSSVNKFGKLLASARGLSRLGLRETARRAGTSHATLRAYEQGSKTPSVETFTRLIEACNFSLEISLQPRISQSNGVKRGDELVEVLNLAEQFPAKHANKLQFPRFPRPK